jgi:hypothetical protein
MSPPAARGATLRMAIVFLCTAGSLLILQSAFDASDHAKAERAVRGYSPRGQSLGQLIEGRAPGGAWSTEITHGCRGVVRVTYQAPGGHWAFDYDVPEHRIHPADDTSRHLLGELTGENPP